MYSRLPTLRVLALRYAYAMSVQVTNTSPILTEADILDA